MSSAQITLSRLYRLTIFAIFATCILRTRVYALLNAVFSQQLFNDIMADAQEKDKLREVKFERGLTSTQYVRPYTMKFMRVC